MIAHRRFNPFVVLSWLAFLIAVAPIARAQSSADKATAEALFETAVSLMEAGSYAEACPKLEASQRLDSGLGTLLFLGECYEKLGRTASAWATFREGESIAQGRGDGERAAIAKERWAALEGRLSKLEIEVSAEGRIAGLEIKQDGALVPEESWGLALPVDPGEHLIEASAPGRRPWSKRITVAEGSSVALLIPGLESAPEEEAPAAPAAATRTVEAPVADGGADEGSTQRTAGIVAGGIGAAGVIVGSVFGLRAISRNSRSLDECAPDDPTRCTPAGKELRDQAFRAATVSTVGFIAGGVGLATGIALYLTAPSSEAASTAIRELRLGTTVGAGTTGLSLEGSF